MQETKSNTQPENKDKNKIRLLLILTLIFFLTSAILGYLLLNQKTETKKVIVKNTELVGAKESLTAELDALKAEHEKLNVDFGELTEELKVKDTELKEKIKYIEKMIKAGVTIDSYRKIKRELETIRKLNKGYFVQIDSLNQQNARLNAENLEVKTELKKEQNKSEALTKDKEQLKSTVDLGSRLKAYDIKAGAFLYKSGGKKEKETTKAKKAEKIKAIMKIGANSIAKKGDRTGYIKIITPDGKILSKNDSDTFVFEGESQFFSDRKDFRYDNEEQELVFAYTVAEDEKIPAGKYEVLIYMENIMVGKASFDLE
jgi:hypothetical protein